jgi:DUF1009 family protein
MGHKGVLGLIAGSGPLPFEVARAAARRDMAVAVAAVERNTDPAIESLATGPFAWFAAGELGRLIAFFRSAGATEVILAGAVSKRALMRDPSALRLDARAMAVLGRLAHRGDDALLRAVADELESEGMPVVDSTAYLGDRLTPEGLLAGAAIDARIEADLSLAMRVARDVGVHDVGQAVAVREGVVLAIEAVEGTDAMLRRAGELGGPGAVAVKVAKPGQDLRFDVPAIGLGTIRLAAEIGLRAIGLEAGRTIVLEREVALAEADRSGVAVVGLRSAAS